jgi:hypothetical protein
LNRQDCILVIKDKKGDRDEKVINSFRGCGVGGLRERNGYAGFFFARKTSDK